MPYEVFVSISCATTGTIKQTACEALKQYRRWQAEGAPLIGVRDVNGRAVTVLELEACALDEREH